MKPGEMLNNNLVVLMLTVPVISKDIIVKVFCSFDKDYSRIFDEKYFVYKSTWFEGYESTIDLPLAIENLDVTHLSKVNCSLFLPINLITDNFHGFLIHNGAVLKHNILVKSMQRINSITDKTAYPEGATIIYWSYDDYFDHVKLFTNNKIKKPHKDMRSFGKPNQQPKFISFFHTKNQHPDVFNEMIHKQHKVPVYKDKSFNIRKKKYADSNEDAKIDKRSLDLDAIKINDDKLPVTKYVGLDDATLDEVYELQGSGSGSYEHPDSDFEYEESGSGDNEYPDSDFEYEESGSGDNEYPDSDFEFEEDSSEDDENPDEDVDDPDTEEEGSGNDDNPDEGADNTGSDEGSGDNEQPVDEESSGDNASIVPERAPLRPGTITLIVLGAVTGVGILSVGAYKLGMVKGRKEVNLLELNEEPPQVLVIPRARINNRQ